MKTRALLLAIASLTSANALAVDMETVKEKTKEAYEASKEATKKAYDASKEKAGELYDKAKNAIIPKRTSRDNRRDSFLSLNLSPFVLLSYPLPKSGLQVGYIVNESLTIDPEYLSGGYGFAVAKLNIGEISDTIISLPVRYFPGNSFNFRGGVSYRKLSATMGDSIVSKIAERPAHLDVLEITSYAVNLGVGNRWQFDNGITLGADWIDINIPVYSERKEIITKYIKDKKDKKYVSNAITILSAFQLTAVKLQMGYTF